MALKQVNLAKIVKQNPPLGETLVQIENYINQAVAQPQSNQQQPPPAVITPQAALSTAVGATSRAVAPPSTLIKRFVNP